MAVNPTTQFHLNDQLASIIKADLHTTRVAPALMGGPGVGKSSYFEGLADEMGTAIFKLQINTMADRGDLTGVRTVPIEQAPYYKQIYIPNEVVLGANDYARANPDKIVLLALEEINRGDTDVISGAMTMVTERKCGNEVLEPNVRIVATGNDSGAISEMDGAATTRFAIYNVVPDLDTFLKVQPNLNPYVKAVLTRKPDLLTCLPDNNTVVTLNGNNDDDDDNNAQALADFEAVFGGENGENRQHANPRTIEGVSHWLNNISQDDLKMLANTSSPNDDNQMVLNNVLISHTGETQFTAELYHEIIADINAGFASTGGGSAASAKPARPDALDAIMQATSRNEIETTLRRLTNDELEAVIAYAMCDDVPRVNTTILDMALTALPARQVSTQTAGVIITAVMQGQINEDAKQTLQNSSAMIASHISQFLNMQSINSTPASAQQNSQPNPATPANPMDALNQGGYTTSDDSDF